MNIKLITVNSRFILQRAKQFYSENCIQIINVIIFSYNIEIINKLNYFYEFTIRYKSHFYNLGSLFNFRLFN